MCVLTQCRVYINERKDTQKLGWHISDCGRVETTQDLKFSIDARRDSTTQNIFLVVDTRHITKFVDVSMLVLECIVGSRNAAREYIVAYVFSGSKEIIEH